MPRQVLIVHGWSDSTASFLPLVRFLRLHGYAPKPIWLGDWLSREDEIRIDDVGRRMGEVIDDLIARGELATSFDMVVHSTGALVARSWLASLHDRGTAHACPVKRLLMLAPANHGSKLAAAGKSFLGRVVKGYDNWFETGKAMLEDLELASPFQWSLAQRDLLVAPGGQSSCCYGEDLVWPFVITGTHPYTSLLRQIVNERGSDGTVRVCAANLNAHGVSIDFRLPADHPGFFQPWGSRLECEAPLAVLPTRSHASIVDPEREDPANEEGIPETTAQKKLLGELILQALGCPDFGSYLGISQLWTLQISESTAALHRTARARDRENYHQYFQVNVDVVDDQGRPVPDYYLEFFSNPERAADAANFYLLSEVVEDVKRNNAQPGLRNFYFDRTDLMENYYPMVASQNEAAPLYMSIAAATPGPHVRYFGRDTHAATQNVLLHLREDMPAARWLKRNTTHYVRIVIPRYGTSDVFSMTRASA